MAQITLGINRQSRTLVNFNGSAVTVPGLYQGNVQEFKIYVLDPPATINSGFSKVDMGSSGLRVSVGQTPTGTAGGPTPLALQDTWTWNATDKSFTGSLSLTSSSIDSFIGSAATATAYFEVNETASGNRITLFQTSFTLHAVVDEATSSVPSSSDVYLTKAESDARYVKNIGDLGAVIVLRSANGVWGRELGVANDGSAIDNIITL